MMNSIFTCYSYQYLRELTNHDKMILCLTYVKGGNNVRYGREATDCRGGGRKPECIERCDLESYQTKEVDRLQGRGCVTHPSKRPESISRQTKDRSKEHTNRITEANLFGLPIVRRLPKPIPHR